MIFAYVTIIKSERFSNIKNICIDYIVDPVGLRLNQTFYAKSLMQFNILIYNYIVLITLPQITQLKFANNISQFKR